MRDLRYKSRPAASGQATSMVVLVHGYGADGSDLLGLADPLSPHLPDTVFVAPDAPEPCAGNAFGFQWSPIPWLDGSDPAQAETRFAASAVDLDAFLDQRLAEAGLTPDRLVILGFSQGAMISLHIAPRRPVPVAGVIAISGRLLVPERLVRESVVRPPVLLIHGDADPVVPFADMAAAGKALTAAGFDTYGHVMKGTGHGIAPDGLGVALQFLKERLRV